MYVCRIYICLERSKILLQYRIMVSEYSMPFALENETFCRWKNGMQDRV